MASTQTAVRMDLDLDLDLPLEAAGTTPALSLLVGGAMVGALPLLAAAAAAAPMGPAPVVVHGSR